MTPTARRMILWSPRVLGILFALFLGIFALDVFEPGRSTGVLVIGLLMHLVPTFVLLAAVAAAWRWEWVGAVVFFALALALGIFNLGRPAAIVLLSGPLIFIALLFAVAWRYRAGLRAGG